MKLTKLEITGFKSFKDRTTVNFAEGISAIVGPNGCGKSNIVDAIRWVMGEQRVTVLRGKKMDDVVFNGSNDASAVGMAEVSLTLNNNGRKFPGKYSEFSEMKIARRIFRDGETEYSINKSPCRLLDIREFFMDAGVGAKTYSIVEQERISRLVEGKPEDRRHFIEEAAGIAKFKNRKEASLRKIESTKQNITRLNDIISEVKTQLAATSRQAKRAEKYKELKKDIRDARLNLALQSLATLRTSRSAMEEARTATDNRVIAAESNLRGQEAAVEALKAELVERDGAVSRLQERYYGLKNDINMAVQEISFSQGKIEELTARRRRDLADIEDLRKRRDSAAGEIEALAVTVRETESAIVEMTSLIDEQERNAESLKDEEMAAREELETAKGRQFDCLTEVSRIRNLLASLSKGIDDIKNKINREERDMEEQESRLSALDKELRSARTALAEDRERAAALKERECLCLDRITEARDDLRTVTEELEELKEDRGLLSSRLASLREIIEERELCTEGTRCVFQKSREIGLPAESLQGLLADHISVPKEYEVAAEAVLGEKLQYLFISDHNVAQQAIDFLKRNSSGRAGFLPATSRATSPCPCPSHLTGEVKLSDVVSTDREDMKKILRSLLEGILVVADLSRAIDLWRKNGFAGTFVTLDGEIIGPQGAVTGGVSGAASILRTKRERQELELELARVNEGLADVGKRRDESEEFLASLREELETLRGENHEIQLALNGREKDIERLNRETGWIKQQLNVHAFNRENLVSEEREAARRTEELTEELQSRDRAVAEANDRIAGLQESWSVTTRNLKEAEGDLIEKKIRLTSREEQKKALADTKVRLERNLEEILRQEKSASDNLGLYDGSIAAIEERLGEATKRRDELSSILGSVEQELSEQRTQSRESETLLRERELVLQQTKKELDGLSKELNRRDMEIRETTMQMENLAAAIYEKFSVNLESLLPQFTSLSPENQDSLEKRLERDRKRLDEFGEVNLLALTEYEQYKERHDFLTKQLADLNASIETLERTINRINGVSRRRFAEAFEGINKCFKEVFPRLFPGGKGELLLIDESDLLETGVEIDIQIPGKRRQSLSLLSGGEKALSAVALIFAILMYRPTPFVILDEADAPLDDTNVTRFRNLVREISTDSQIICITHNKKTMGSADNLIGVTMEKNGISSIVSVNLN